MSASFVDKLAKRISNFSNFYNSTSDDKVIQGQRMAALVAAACLLRQHSTVGQACLAYMLILLHEFKDPVKGTELLLRHMHKPGEQMATMVEDIAREHEEERQKKGLTAFNNQSILARELRNLNENWYDEFVASDTCKKLLKEAATRLFSKDPSSAQFGAATLQETVSGERMSWTLLLAAFHADDENAPSPSIAGLMRQLVRLMDYRKLRVLLTGAQAGDDDDDGPAVAAVGNEWGNEIATPAEVKQGVVIANSIGTGLAVYKTTEAVYGSSVDRAMLIRGPSQPNTAFSLQYGTHSMLLNADASDWMHRKTSTIFSDDRANQMSATAVLALVRTGCDLPPEIFVNAASAQDVDAATEAMLLGTQSYNIRCYVVWKTLFCTSGPLLANFARISTASIFAPRKLDPHVHGDELHSEVSVDSDRIHCNQEINWMRVLEQGGQPSDQQEKYVPVHFMDEWLNLRGEKKVSHDLFLMIRKLLLDNGLINAGSGRVGSFAMFSEGPGAANEPWDDGIVVFQTTLSKKVGRTRAGREEFTLYETLYTSGQVRWHTDKEIQDGKLFMYANVSEYLVACNTTLAKWAARFENGKGPSSGEASDAFLDAWDLMYSIG